jgi:N-terminal acetyltransferase B complex non-catalytic subunit
VNSPGEAEFKCTTCTKSCGLFCKSCLEDAVNEAIISYRIAIDDDGQISKTLLTTDQHPADDLSILAAMCLIKLSLMNPEQGTEPLKRTETTYVLQATVLLENAWTHSKHNFQISLLLVRLYSYLGCGSLAMRAYHRLALKQIQLDTLSYTLFDRLSSLHPHSSGQSTEASSKQKTPLEHLQKQQKLYKSSREHIKKNSWLSFKHGSYNSIFEMREVSEMLCHSMSAAMSVIESRKISRLIEPGAPLTETSNGFDLLRKFIFSRELQTPAKETTAPDMEDPETKISNTLDYESFPNFETSRGPRFEELSRYNPGLSVRYLEE